MVCRLCGVDKPADEFYAVTNKGRKAAKRAWTYHRTECKKCNNAATKTRYAKNRPKYMALCREHYKRNREPGGMYDYSRLASCARRRGATQFCTKEEWVELRKGTACAWCGCLLHQAFTHVDHIVPLCQGGEHTRDNLVLSCANCNVRREWERKVNNAKK